MSRYRFVMIGSAQAPIVEVGVSCLSDLAAQASCSRWIEGEIVEVDGEAVSHRVLLPTGRIQMVVDENCS